MKKSQNGFTLIELVMVIVILGILAAVAVPKYISLEGSARQAATDGVAGAAGSAMVINYAARSANVANGSAISDCQNVASALQGGLPAGYTVGTVAIANGATGTCTVTRTSGGETATFTGLGIS